MLWENLAELFGFSRHYFWVHITHVMRKVLHILKLVIATNTLLYTTVNSKFFHFLDFSLQLIGD